MDPFIYFGAIFVYKNTRGLFAWVRAPPRKLLHFGRTVADRFRVHHIKYMRILITQKWVTAWTRLRYPEFGHAVFPSYKIHGENCRCRCPQGTGAARWRTHGSMDTRGKCTELPTRLGGRAWPLTPDGRVIWSLILGVWRPAARLPIRPPAKLLAHSYKISVNGNFPS